MLDLDGRSCSDIVLGRLMSRVTVSPDLRSANQFNCPPFLIVDLSASRSGKGMVTLVSWVQLIERGGRPKTCTAAKLS